MKLETTYNIISTQDPEEALRIAENRTVDVVAADYLMPRMNAIEFLEVFGKLQPLAARILVAGYADKENGIKAVNLGLFHFIEKPWENDRLIRLLHAAVREMPRAAQII